MFLPPTRWHGCRRSRGFHFVNAAVAAVPVGVGVGVGGALVKPIGDINGAVRSQGEVAGSKPGVVGHEQFAAIAGSEGGTPGFEVVPLNGVAEEIAGDVFATKLFGERIALINDSAIGDVAAREVLIWHMVEVTVGVGIVQRAMFAETFPVIAALDAMEHPVGSEGGYYRSEEHTSELQ